MVTTWNFLNSSGLFTRSRELEILATTVGFPKLSFKKQLSKMGGPFPMERCSWKPYTPLNEACGFSNTPH